MNRVPWRSFVLYLILCPLFFSCRHPPAPTQFRGVAMTIPYCIQIGDALDDEKTLLVEKTILSLFSEINTTYNNWNPSSEISQLNRLPAGQKVFLSPQLSSFLIYVNQIVAFTEGRFDPTVEPLQLLWKKCLKEGHLPPQESLDTLTPVIGWGKVHFENGQFWKDHSLTAIDLGGIAKGYAVDILVERLSTLGFSRVYVEWGGEIRTHGHHPQSRPWKIGIEGLKTIELSNAAIATSGSYAQQWTIDQVNYTHIIDPDFKHPLYNSPISSVSVIASTCREADALATALMLFHSKEAADLWAKEKKIKAFIW